MHSWSVPFLLCLDGRLNYNNNNNTHNMSSAIMYLYLGMTYILILSTYVISLVTIIGFSVLPQSIQLYIDANFALASISITIVLSVFSIPVSHCCLFHLLITIRINFVPFVFEHESFIQFSVVPKYDSCSYVCIDRFVTT